MELVSCKNIVEQHLSKISVKNNPIIFTMMILDYQEKFLKLKTVYNFFNRVNLDLSGSMSSCISTLLTIRTL